MKSTLLALAVSTALLSNVGFAGSSISTSSSADAQFSASSPAGNAQAAGTASSNQSITLNGQDVSRQQSAAAGEGAFAGAISAPIPSPASSDAGALDALTAEAEGKHREAQATGATTAASARSSAQAAIDAGQSAQNDKREDVGRVVAGSAERVEGLTQSARDRLNTGAEHSMRQRLRGDISADISQRARADLHSTMRNSLSLPASSLGL